MRRTSGAFALLAVGLGTAGVAWRLVGGTPSTIAGRTVAMAQVPVRFEPRVRVAEYAGADRVRLDRVGVVEAGGGALAGGTVLLLRVDGERGVCKGPGCSGPYYARLISAGGRLIHLPRLTPEGAWLASLLAGGTGHQEFAEDSLADRTLLAFLAGYGTLEVDSGLIIPALAVRREFTFRGLRFRMVAGDADGVPDTTVLRPAFEHPELGPLFTTRPERSPQAFFYYPETVTAPDDPDAGIWECRDEACYGTNAFFLFRPDGTYLSYTFDPPFTGADIRLGGPARMAAEYLHWTRWGCSEGQADYHSVVSPAVLDPARLRPIGMVAGTGAPILAFPEPGDTYVRAFYDRYLAARDAWLYGDEPPPVTFDDFTAELPVFFWRDPFGRLIRFTNAAYLPPLTCEPVVYLYPEHAGAVTVRLGDRVRVLDADPAYAGSWSVRAWPDGRLTAGGEPVPFLFWEGAAGFLPRPAEGFVVARTEVEPFFRRTLPRLGLVDGEIRDFLAAWLPAFTDAPWYRIGFYDPETVDRYAPLEVAPAPATVIRVLFDYQGLAAPVALREPALPPAPERRGFTVVEWGGLKR